LRKLAGPEIDRLERSRAFLASPLSRTRETMQLARAAMGLDPEAYALSDDLKELTFGDWEGLTWPEVEARDPKGAAARAAGKWEFAPPNGESYAGLAKRLAPWVEAIDRDLFVASHGGVARALMHLIAGVSPAVASEVSVHQGRAILFANATFRWLG
jgi:probable phosphoglycerate mutase